MKKSLLKLFRTFVKVVIFAGVAVAGWYAYSYYMPAEEEVGLGELPTAVATVRDITVSVEATGVLQPIKIVEIKSKASGEILRMPVEVGDTVAKGDLIAQVDTQILDQEMKQVTADYDSAVVRLDIAGAQYERAKSLYDQDLVSEDELESIQQTFTSAEAQLLRNEADMELARERLADATVRAPSAGTVIAKTVEEGQIIASSTNNVSGGTTLVQMADLSELEVRTLVDEVDIGQVRPGLRVESKVEAFADRSFSGEVIMIEPQAVVQQSVTSFPVISRIANNDGKLLPGMNADVSVVVHRRPGVLTIPNEAVRIPSDATEVQRMLGMLPDDGTSGGAGFGSRGGGNASRGGSRRGNGEAGAGQGSAAQRGIERGDSAGQRGAGDRSGEGADTGDASGQRGIERGSRGGGTDAGDVRERLQNASPQERARMMAAMREAAEGEDEDPFGIEGRREDAVVFAKDAAGRIVTRDIVVGARDWEHTEVLSGLSPGDEVVILPSTALLRSQDRLRSWAQGRSGLPGIGGGGAPRGGRR